MEKFWKWLLHANARAVLAITLVMLIAVCGWWTWKERHARQEPGIPAGRPSVPELRNLGIAERVDSALTNGVPGTDPFRLPLHERFFTVSVTPGTNGVIEPPGPVAVRYGGDVSFSLAPAAHHHVGDILVNGLSVGATNTLVLAGITNHTEVRAEFAIDRCALVVRSPFGTPTPAGTVLYDYGASNIVCTIDGSPWEADGTQQVCVGWSGTGSVPRTGRNRSVSITITNDSTLTWRWNKRLRFSAQADPNGRVTVRETWFPPGAKAVAHAQPNKGYRFKEWTGDFQGADNPLIREMDRPYSVTATFEAVPAAITTPLIQVTNKPVEIARPAPVTPAPTVAPPKPPREISLTYRGIFTRSDGKTLVWMETEEGGQSRKAFFDPNGDLCGLTIGDIQPDQLEVVQPNGATITLKRGTRATFKDGKHVE